MKAILHIGTEKTGSTSLQVALAAHRPVLEAHGYRYARCLGEEQHSALALYAVEDLAAVADLAHGHGVVDEAGRERFRRRMERRLATEARLFPDAVFLLSSEHCHSRVLTEGDVRRLHRLLIRHFDEIEIVVYLRRQDRMAVSYYSTHLKSGGTDPATIPPAVALDYFDHAALLRRWQAVFGNVLRVSAYDPVGARLEVVEDFMDWVLPGVPVPEQPPHHNHGLSAEVQEAIRLLNRRRSDLSAEQRQRLIDAAILVDSSRGRRGGAQPSRAAAQRFVARFTAGNAWIARQCLDGEPLFDDDFGKYGVEPTTPDYLVVAEILQDVLVRTARSVQSLGEENSRLHHALGVAGASRAQLQQSVNDLCGKNAQLRGALEAAGAGSNESTELLTSERTTYAAREAEIGYYAGLVHLDAGQHAAARDFVLKALSFAPERALLWHLLARAYAALGDGVEAREAIGRAIALEPDNAIHRRIRDETAGLAE